MADENILVEVCDLHKYFPRKSNFLGRTVASVKAVDGVSFSIHKGETLGLVGESGCGKTTTGRCILQLYKPTAGKVYFQGKDLSRYSQKALRKMRRDMQLIFEDPYYSLDPRMCARDIIAEPLRIHKIASGEECLERVEELLMMVQIDPDMADRFPHEFSAGQRQRIEIARALATRPSFVVCDNPVAQLDVSIQAQITSLLKWFQGWLNLTYLFVAHDLALVRNFCDRVMVMYAGKIMEIANSRELYRNPLHPYTKVLLLSVPLPDPEIEASRLVIELPGETPSPLHPPAGCRFQPRCFIAQNICRDREPELKDTGSGHLVACHRV